jgi:hypothetical protein
VNNFDYVEIFNNSALPRRAGSSINGQEGAAWPCSAWRHDADELLE